MTPESSQMIESQKHDLVRVANLLGLPPSKLGADVNTSYASLEWESKSLLSDCLDPHLVLWEQECERKLLTNWEYDTNSRYIEHDRNALLSIDAKTEKELLITQLNNGLLSWEECRQKMNLSIEKDESMEWRRPANIVIDGEAPPQAPQSPVVPPEAPTQETPPEEAQTAQQLTEGILQRAVARWKKSPKPLAQHKDILIEQLAAYPNAEDWVDNLMMRLDEELSAVLPEQRDSVLDRINITEEIKTLCK
jgi:hypothetical protein